MPPYTHFFGVSYLYFLAVQEELIMLLGQGIIPGYRGRNKRTLWSLSLPMITGGRDKIPWTSLEHSSYRQFDVPRNDDYAEILPPLLGFLPNFSTPDFFLLFFSPSRRGHSYVLFKSGKHKNSSGNQCVAFVASKVSYYSGGNAIVSSAALIGPPHRLLSQGSSIPSTQPGFLVGSRIPDAPSRNLVIAL